MKPLTLLAASTLYFFIVSAAAGEPPEKTASWFWQMGFEATRENAPDTALSLLKKAYNKGVSDDSLYYLWSEIFIGKNVLDTALALNLSIQPTNGIIHRKALEQRCSIYTRLGWNNEAQIIRDSISGRHFAVLRRIAPECNIALAGGAYREKSLIDHHYPYPRSTDSTATISDGSGDASLRLGWQVPAGKTQTLQLGVRLRYSGSRFSTITINKKLNDSTDLSVGGYCRYKLFSDRLALGYTCNRRKDFLDRESFLHQFALQYAVTTEKWLRSLSAGYNYRNPYQRHSYYLMLMLDHPIGRKDDLSFTLNFSGMTIDEYMYPTGNRYLDFQDGTLYSPSSDKSIVTKLDLAQAGYANLQFTLPQSYLGCSPSLHYEHQLSKKAVVGIDGGYQVTRYRKDYTWMDVHYQPGHQPTTGIQTTGNGSASYLVYNVKNQRYYWVDSILMSGQTISGVTLDTLPLTFHSERRVDQTLSLNLFFNYSIGKAGAMQLDATAARNFSNLAHAAPIDIQVWSGEMTLTWFFRFKP